MNLKKLLAGSVAMVTLLAATVGVSFGNASMLNDPELTSAVSWMEDNNLTRYDNASDYNPAGLLTRDQAAHMFAAYAVSNLCMEGDSSMSCDFDDASTGDYSLRASVVAACQLGLVKGSGGNYYPNDNITKAAVLTIMDRAISAAAGVAPAGEDMNPRWAGHHENMYDLGITKETDPWALDRAITRYEAALMLYRARYDAECEEEVDFTDYLNDLLDLDDVDTDDSDDDMSDDDDDDTDNSPSNASGGDVEVELSATTPVGDTVPGRANINVAEFDFTANGGAVTVNAIDLTRYGIGNDDAVERVSIFTKDGVRLSNDKTFNTDDEAFVSLNPHLVIPAGDTVTIMVIAEIGCGEDDSTLNCTASNNASNQEFIIGISGVDAISANGDVEGNFPVKANEFEVAAVNAPVISVEPDGSLSDVEVGEMHAEIAEFEVENDSNEDEVFLTSITFTDGENNIDRAAENFVLECDGDEVATTDSASDEYLTFILDAPLQIEEGQSVDCSVFADIVAEAGEQLDLYIDESIDVLGQSDFGFGLAVDIDQYPEGSQRVDILAGELTLIELDLETDEIKDDSEDVVLGRFEVHVNNGSDLFIEDIAFDLFSDSPVALDSIFEDFEVYDATNGARYDLNESCTNIAANNSCTLNEENIDIFLTDAEVIVLEVRADTVTTYPAGVADLVTVNLELDATPPNACPGVSGSPGGLVIKENDDDEEVCKIVPGLITFEDIELVESVVDISEIPLSDIDVVRGATEVVALQFQIETDEVSSATLSEITIEGDANFTDDFVSAVRLYRGIPQDGGFELLEAEGGFDIAGTQISFDDFDDVLIFENSTQPFFVTVDVIDDQSNIGQTFTLNVATSPAPDLEDEDNDDMQVFISSTGTRTIRIEDLGTLVCEFDNVDNATDKPSIIVGGNESGLLASFKIIADNEPIWIRDLAFTASPAARFEEAFERVMLIADDGVTELYDEYITSSVMFLNEIGDTTADFIVDEGTENVYVKLLASPIGDGQKGVEAGPYTLTMSIEEAQGVSSSNELAVAACTGMSEEFFTRSVAISTVDLLSSAGSISVPTQISNGVSNNLAIIAVTADASNNTDTNGTDLDLALQTINVQFENGTLAAITDISIRRLGESLRTPVTTAPAGTSIVTFDMTLLDVDADNLIEPGTTEYFVVEGTPNTPAGTDDEAIRVNLVDLYGDTATPAFRYQSDGTFPAPVLSTAVFMDTEEVDGVEIKGSSN